MRLLFCVFLLLISGTIQAQINNLVPNPSFEDTLSCPISSGEIYKAPPWFDPALATPDYFNACNTGGLNVPDNVNGTQDGHQGVAYAGIVYYISFGYREYIETALIEPLIKNYKYCVEFYVSLSDNSKFAGNKIGIYFSNDSVFENLSYPVLNYQPQVTSINNGFVVDKENWVLISGDYIAEGGEKFILIGNFYDNNNTDTLNVGGAEPAAYYYIDDVSVVLCEAAEIKIPNVFTPNNDEWNNQFIVENLPEGATVEIYNRWGALVAEWNTPNGSWDGRTKGGAESSAGVYYCIVKLVNGEHKSSFLQLLR